MREGVLQQLQRLEAIKMHMAEQKLAEQTRLCSDLDVRLQAACATLDVSSGTPLPAKTVPAGPLWTEHLAFLGMAWEVAHGMATPPLGLHAIMVGSVRTMLSDKAYALKLLCAWLVPQPLCVQC